MADKGAAPEQIEEFMATCEVGVVRRLWGLGLVAVHRWNSS